MNGSQSCALKQYIADTPADVRVLLADVSEIHDDLVPEEACEDKSAEVKLAVFLTANNKV